MKRVGQSCRKNIISNALTTFNKLLTKVLICHTCTAKEGLCSQIQEYQLYMFTDHASSISLATKLQSVVNIESPLCYYYVHIPVIMSLIDCNTLSSPIL